MEFVGVFKIFGRFSKIFGWENVELLRRRREKYRSSWFKGLEWWKLVMFFFWWFDVFLFGDFVGFVGDFGGIDGFCIWLKLFKFCCKVMFEYFFVDIWVVLGGW